MKKKEAAAAKKASKAFKKELTEKIAIQLQVIAGETGINSKKASKAIQKAAKNLAKKISKYNIGNNAAVKSGISQPVVDVQTPVAEKTIKVKSSTVKKAAN